MCYHGSLMDKLVLLRNPARFPPRLMTELPSPRTRLSLDLIRHGRSKMTIEKVEKMSALRKVGIGFMCLECCLPLGDRIVAFSRVYPSFFPIPLPLPARYFPPTKLHLE